jgi:hypothetical protein
MAIPTCGFLQKEFCLGGGLVLEETEDDHVLGPIL